MNREIHLPSGSRSLPQSASRDQQANPHISLPPAPHPASARSPLSPPRRENVNQLPTLTTSLGGLSNQGFGFGFSAGYSPAPMSATSLSSPFSQNNAAAYVASPGGDSRASSPMASRAPGSYNAPYNPREWGFVGGDSPQLGAGQFLQSHQASSQARNPQRSHNEVAPPPPYSPKLANTQSRTSTSTTLSPADTLSTVGTSQYNTPITASTTISQELPTSVRRQRPRPLSMIHQGDSGSWQSSFPPPPPISNKAVSRSSSRTPVDRIHNVFNISSLTGRHKQSTSSPQLKAIDTLQRDTAEAIQRPLQPLRSDAALKAPASRRAASAGTIGNLSTSSRETSRSKSRSPVRNGGWAPGMPLPGPPPGPPPSSSRSHSASAVSDASSRQMLAPAPRPKARQAPALGTWLGPVPPTPAGWIDEERKPSPSRLAGPLHIDTSNISRREEPSSNHSTKPDASDLPPAHQHAPASGLSRRAAKRDTSVQGIRERRSASKSASKSARNTLGDDSSASSSSSNPWAGALAAVRPSDLDLSQPPNDRRTLKKSTIQAAESTSPDTYIASARSKISESSSQSTPRLESAPLKVSLDRLAQTPPFSPGGESQSPSMKGSASLALPPMALPTPPAQQSRPPSSSSFKTIDAQPQAALDSSRRMNISSPVSMPQSLIPHPLTTQSDASDHNHPGSEVYAQESLERHKDFLRKERVAADDDERFHIFADYILSEARIRRTIYTSSWHRFDIQSVRRNLFELTSPTTKISGDLPLSTSSSPTGLSSHPGLDPSQGRGESNWWNNYHPSLSPIASMSNNDEMSSRGRAPSRWWESQTGSDSDGRARKVERSKRESKYMGLPRELREAMQRGYSDMDSIDRHLSNEPQCPLYDSPEYPPEKIDPETFGYQDEVESSPFQSTSGLQPDTPRIAEKSGLDVSRLVTLPPPFPRHHPAVNNNHPDLLSYRAVVRAVSDLSEVASRRNRYNTNMEALQADSKRKMADNRRLFRSNIQAQIQEGSISYAEAAEAEEALNLEERQLEKQRICAEFDSFQDVVLNPIHEILHQRVSQTSSKVDELRSELDSDAEDSNPNQTQEEGDEQPELLEKLTLLKWLFEAREVLHREIFQLLTERNEKYKATVLLPYQQPQNRDKIRDTEAFFANDDLNRRVVFESETLARHKSFLEVIEANVIRGVELQLSAFWDIAPNLLALLQSIPDELCSLIVQIPAKEYIENPSYHQHPLQYLYSLLLHAQRSTYQFIESQTNLLCLLHEAKCGVMVARSKLIEVQQIKSGDEFQEAREQIQWDFEVMRRSEEKALTKDLKERVSIVEEQWTEALGSQLEATKERIKSSLVDARGWDEMEEA